jgi:hypothetical protein
MIAIIQTATNAARTTKETQVQKVPNGRLKGAYGGLTDLFAMLKCEVCAAGTGKEY